MYTIFQNFERDLLSYPHVRIFIAGSEMVTGRAVRAKNLQGSMNYINSNNFTVW
jgi:hypothetical protein